ncbi:unnamed protein product [Rotaria sp. Silwood2]|nr:unnamed protein product [Rotaria sp. Silwood2]
MIIKVLSVLSNNEWEEYFPELSEYTLAKLLLLSRITMSNSCVEELTRCDDLLLLLNAISNARCISQCVNNLRQETWDLSSVDMAHVYQTLICLLIESASLSPSLMNDFRLVHCYVHMKDIILR